MKTKKALKRLRRVEELLSIVIDQYARNEHGVRKLLDSAKRSVIRAKAGINSLSAPGIEKKPQVKAKQTKRPNLTAEGRERISPPVMKRRAAAKRAPERKGGTPVRSAGGTTKSDSLTPPSAKAERSLVPEGSPELNQERRAN